MERLIERCCGLDVHKATVSACVRVTQRPGGELKQEVRTFATTTPELLALREWLSEQRVTHVAMEATGVYWKPIYYMLEDGFELLLVNPAHFKQVPGRKTRRRRLRVAGTVARARIVAQQLCTAGADS